MYETYWGISESPFRNTIHARWYHDSQVHEEALARLFFLVEQARRCGLLVGPAGTGKSFLLNLLHRQIARTQRHVAFVDLLGLGCEEMLEQLATGLKLGDRASRSRNALWRDVEDSLKGSHACRVQTVLILDHLERAPAETVRAVERILHVGGATGDYTSVVVTTRTLELSSGPTSLGEMADLRIILSTLDRQQTGHYVEQLLFRAGCRETIFDEAALDALYEQSLGIPRNINRLCDLSLLAAMGAEQTRVDERIVVAASLELQTMPDFVFRAGKSVQHA
jgi:type II secretory pathway predicted ATPase ExeA